MKLTNIAIKDAVQSKTNVAGRTAGKAFDELVASIKEKGVLVPVLARETEKGFEVIAGNRRLAAAKEAGLETIPAQLVKMTDTEAREAQIVENLQREDIHPLDEGELYRKLIEEAKYDTASIAAKVAKPEPYVKQRLFLTNLITPAADAFRAGKILDGHAVLIAKLSTTDQQKALKASTDRYNTMTVKELKEWIAENIYTQLDNQPWLGKPEIEAALGKHDEACGVITAVQSLFGPVKQGACTSMKCWAKRMDAYISYRIQESKKNGAPGMAKISSEYGQAQKGIYSRSEFVQVAKKGKDRCKSVHSAIVVNGADIGQEMDICTDPNCQTHRGMKSQYGLTPKEQEARRAERKAELLKQKKAKAARKATLEAALQKIKWPLKDKHLEALLTLAFHISGANTARSIAKRRELEIPKTKNSWGSGFSYDYSKALKTAMKEMDKTEKVRLAFELLIDTGYDSLREGIGQL